MRLSGLWLVQSLLATAALSNPAPKKHSTPQDIPAGARDTPPSDVDDAPKDTVFNGQQVPPIMMLSGDKYQDTISHGYWLIEAFSPYCSHCRSLAPKWQTLYEYYFTSEPVPGSSLSPAPDAAQTSLNSFSRYYNFKFAKLDCTAYMDACTALGVSMFPTLVLLKNGEELKKSSGDKDMETLAKFVEEGLEIIRPGSRPKDGIELPEVGAAQSKDFNDRRIAKAAGNTPAGPTKPDTVPNHNGTSVALTSETFEEKIKQTLDPWFVKFYAPWCHHCQHLAPAWATMAHDMESRLNIGEVNCDEQKALCRANGVRAYPTIKLLRGPEVVEYQGLRGVGDLLDYANKAAKITSGVPNVTLSAFEELEQTEDAIFVYFYDDATASEDFEALERLPLHILGRAPIVKSSDKALAARFRISTFPRLLAARAGAPTIYPKQTPQEMRDVTALVDWMSAHWLPLVPELSATNAREVMHGHYAVLGVLNRDHTATFSSTVAELRAAAASWVDSETAAYNDERQRRRDAKTDKIAAAAGSGNANKLRDAKQLKVEMARWERKRPHVSFAWVDAVFWERWLRTTFGLSAADGESIIIYDVDNHRYWTTTPTGTRIPPTRAAILETVLAISANPRSISSQTTDGALAHVVFATWRSFVTQPLTSGAVALAVAAAVLVAVGRWRRRRRAARDGFAHLAGKDGILGAGMANGKAD